MKVSRKKENIYARAWYAKHKERVQAERRALPHDYKAEYQKRRENILAWHRENAPRANKRRTAYMRDPEYKAREVLRQKGYRQKGHHMVQRSKTRAKRRGWAFDLTKAWIEERLARGICEVSGVPFTARGEKGPCAPSIDRRDSSKGYTQSNCRVIVWALNAAFNEWGEEAFVSIFKVYLQNKAARV